MVVSARGLRMAACDRGEDGSKPRLEVGRRTERSLRSLLRRSRCRHTACMDASSSLAPASSWSWVGRGGLAKRAQILKAFQRSEWHTERTECADVAAAAAWRRRPSSGRRVVVAERRRVRARATLMGPTPPARKHPFRQRDGRSYGRSTATGRSTRFRSKRQDGDFGARGRARFVFSAVRFGVARVASSGAYINARGRMRASALKFPNISLLHDLNSSFSFQPHARTATSSEIALFSAI